MVLPNGAFLELVAIGGRGGKDIVPGPAKPRGWTRHIDPGKRSAREPSPQLFPHLWTPMRERVYSRQVDGRVNLRLNLQPSGVSALSELTMMADDPWVTYAAYPAAQTLSVLLAEGWEVAEEGDSPDILVESWAHAFPRLRFFSPG